MLAIKCEGLRKEYRDTIAVDGLDLAVEDGELFSLLGVNGAGKTTTVKMLSCLTQPTGGDAYLYGKSILRSAPDAKRLLAISPQETAVAPALTVYENMEMMCGIYGFSKEMRRTSIEELLDQLDMRKIGKKQAGKLSGGWQRRLSIAMALISKPKILFLDEPTLGLDVLARRELWDVIRSLKRKTTVILTTHYMEEAENLSDHVGIMKDGKLLACATVDKIKEIGRTDNFEQAFVHIVSGMNRTEQ